MKKEKMKYTEEAEAYLQRLMSHGMDRRKAKALQEHNWTIESRSFFLTP